MLMPFSFTPLPEIAEEAMAEEMHSVGIEKDSESFWKQYRCIFGFVAQFSYVYVLSSTGSSHTKQSMAQRSASGGSQSRYQLYD